jgi:transcriptional regulator with GAF, ATPase, and Fis domain
MARRAPGKRLRPLLCTSGRSAVADFVAVNCAALPEALAESELFGHEKGAFTGAVAQKLGCWNKRPKARFSSMKSESFRSPLQAKLLRAIETQRIVRVGGSRELPIDVRLVAATHRDLEDEVKAGPLPPRPVLSARSGASRACPRYAIGDERSRCCCDSF